jgi:hypothetical protein
MRCSRGWQGSRWTVPWHPTPPSTTHVSIYALIPVDWEHTDKEAIWADIAPRADEVLRDSCRTAEPFSMSFRRLRAFPRAIVVATDPVPTFISWPCAGVCVRRSLAHCYLRVTTTSCTPPWRASRHLACCPRESGLRSNHSKSR